MKKTVFVEKFNEAIRDEESSVVAVKILQPNDLYECIVFKRESFEDKFDYYMNAYNSNMELSSYSDIKIVDITYGNDIGKVVESLLED